MTLDKALIILKFIPAIIAVIKSLEAFLPVEGAGATKLEIVRTALETTYTGLQDIWPALVKIIGVIVEAANKFDVFNKPTV